MMLQRQKKNFNRFKKPTMLLPILKSALSILRVITLLSPTQEK
jgi:hypothetical protein